jgi:hypothetical protein
MKTETYSGREGRRETLTATRVQTRRERNDRWKDVPVSASVRMASAVASQVTRCEDDRLSDRTLSKVQLYAKRLLHPMWIY